jgi:hypothetical protein
LTFDCIPRAWRAIAAADVAAALARAVPRTQGQRVLSSGAMQGASRSRTGDDKDTVSS